MDVGNLHQRVRWAFEPHQFGLVRDGRFHEARVLGVDKMEHDAHRRVVGPEQPRSAAVQVLTCDDFVTRLQRLKHRVNRRESRSKGQAVGSAFQLRKRRFKRGPCRVVAARVLPSLVHTDGLLHIGGRLENGGHDGPRRRIRLHSGMHRARAFAQFFQVFHGVPKLRSFRRVRTSQLGNTNAPATR